MALLLSHSSTSNGDFPPRSSILLNSVTPPSKEKRNRNISRLSMSEPHHDISPRMSHLRSNGGRLLSMDAKIDDDDDLPVSNLTYGAPSPAHMAKMPNIVSPMAVFHANSFGAKSYDEADLPSSSFNKKKSTASPGNSSRRTNGSKRRQIRKKTKNIFRKSPLKTISDSEGEEAENDNNKYASDQNGQSERSTASSRHMLGAATPFYGTSENEGDQDPHRLGIEPGNYDKPSEDSIPFSPFGLANKKEEKTGPRPSPFDFHMNGDDDDEQRNQSQGWPHHEIVPVSPRSVDQDLNDEPLKTENAMVHEQTAKGQFLLNSTKMIVSPHANLKFNLDEHSGGITSDLIKRASERALQLDIENEQREASSSRPLLAIDRLPKLLRRGGGAGSSDENRLVSSQRRSTASLGLPSVSSSVLHCADPFKIFVLLLQPRAKIFELIQMIYSPMDTTVGDMIDMIPDNATEPALGNQRYIGFTRPNGGEEIMDLDQLASGKHGSMFGDEYSSSTSCARITRGEILIAIPETYRGPQICSIGKPILSNKKLVMLLKRKDPLKTPTPLSNKSSSNRRSSGSKSVGGSVCSATSSLASRDDSSTSTFGASNMNASMSEGISPAQQHTSTRSSRAGGRRRNRRPYSFRRSSSIKEDEDHDES